MVPQNPASNDDRTREYLRLLRQHERRLQGFILALVPSWGDAEDIAQDVRVRLWEQFDSYDRTKDFGAWARTIAYYQVLTYREKKSRHRALIFSESLEMIAKEASAASDDADTEQRVLMECFEKLPEARKDLLMRYYSDKQTAREIAAELGQHFHATRQTILRTRMALRDCVEETLRKEGRR
jgi:RNA polymerase sigma-70 factor (ECF subfamily)